MNAQYVAERTSADAFATELAASVRNDKLHLILLPTEKCNFRCTYCYEDFAIGRMTDSTIQGIKYLIDRRLDQLRFLSISWFGGEPLLARQVVEDISAHVVSAVADRPNVKYVGDMTTNGYFLDTLTVKRLSALGINEYQISLDGPPQAHDRTRIQANGSGSFHRIWDNLLEVRDSSTPVNILLRVHLTPSNMPFMPRFLEQIRDTFLGDARFSVLLKPVERLGGANDDHMDVLRDDERSEIFAELESIALAGGEARRLQPAPEVCYAARPNSLMIRANGTLGKCTVALSDSANSIGRLRPDGTLELDNKVLRPWLRGWESHDWTALSCPANSLPRSEPMLLQISPTRPKPDMLT